jgi:cytochrome c-type biogenesis protein CcmH/NrfF
MGMIVTKCPVTGHTIDTGIETDADTFKRITTIASRVWCPHCQSEHEWSAADASIAEEGAGSAA